MQWAFVFFFFMSNIYCINDLNINGYKGEFLDLLSLICILFGIYIIISKNPIVSVLFLIGLFSAVSVYLILIGLVFIGISYLLVYVGAVSILFLFILMLINIRISELLSNNNNFLFLAIISVISFVYIIGQNIPFNTLLLNYNYSFNDYLYNIKQFEFIQKDLTIVNSNSWDTILIDVTDISSIGYIMYTSYSIWLIITSIILLLAMIGAIIITIK